MWLHNVGLLGLCGVGYFGYLLGRVTCTYVWVVLGGLSGLDLICLWVG